LNPKSLRDGMAGMDVVFHMAAWYKTGGADWMQAEAINVEGTRNVLTVAHELGIPKIVYTSTVAVFGDTRGHIADEGYIPGNGPFLSEYDRTKWMAHYKVAKPLIDAGAPIILVMPGVVYGPGDTSLIGQLMKAYYKGQMPVVPGPELSVSWAHVDDVAEGHILAAERGKVGESYILAGPAIPLGEMVDFWAYLTGRPAPLAKVPAKFLHPLAPVMGVIGEKVTLPEVLTKEAIMLLGATYTARGDKARTELGWRPRPPQAGMMETFQWLAQHETQLPTVGKERKIAGILATSAILLFIVWLFTRKKK
jgi:nucleoside-diphosphate-sugar epimerase